MKAAHACAISALLFVSAVSFGASAQDPVPMTPTPPTAVAAPNQKPATDPHEIPQSDPSRLEPVVEGDRRWLGTRLMIVGGVFFAGSLALGTTGAVMFAQNASSDGGGFEGSPHGKGIAGAALMGGAGLSAVLGFTLLAVGGSLRRSSASAAFSVGPRGASATLRF
jgi:hypothetical protein